MNHSAGVDQDHDGSNVESPNLTGLPRAIMTILFLFWWKDKHDERYITHHGIWRKVQWKHVEAIKPLRSFKHCTMLWPVVQHFPQHLWHPKHPRHPRNQRSNQHDGWPSCLITYNLSNCMPRNLPALSTKMVACRPGIQDIFSGLVQP